MLNYKDKSFTHHEFSGQNGMLPKARIMARMRSDGEISG